MGTPGCRSFLHASFEPHHGGSLDEQHLDRNPTRRRQAVHEPTRRANRDATNNPQRHHGFSTRQFGAATLELDHEHDA